MVAITYNLTPEDYEEFKRERQAGIGQRILRIIFVVLAGCTGLFTIWQAIFVFPWNRPFANLLFTGMGLVCIWGGLGMPGLWQFLTWLYDPYAQCELQIDEGRIICSCRDKSREFRWRPARGFRESEKYFFLRAERNEARWAVPKRAIVPEQESRLRELVLRASVER